jgi:hypothetical protein
MMMVVVMMMMMMMMIIIITTDNINRILIMTLMSCFHCLYKRCLEPVVAGHRIPQNFPRSP